ncbi:hypothetical protein L0F63_005371 [Massospora cicadina]|nr:hypothetical protein L0F63_005371 [Massospora cicadina]
MENTMAISKSSGQKFIARNGAPRVQIEYDLPFVMGVMADLVGAGRRPARPAAKALKPRVAFQADNTLTGEGRLNIDLTFNSMEDFSPDAVARNVEPLNKLEAQLISKILQDPTLLKRGGINDEQPIQQQRNSAGWTQDEFSSLLRGAENSVTVSSVYPHSGASIIHHKTFEAGRGRARLYRRGRDQPDLKKNLQKGMVSSAAGLAPVGIFRRPQDVELLGEMARIDGVLAELATPRDLPLPEQGPGAPGNQKTPYLGRFGGSFPSPRAARTRATPILKKRPKAPKPRQLHRANAAYATPTSTPFKDDDGGYMGPPEIAISDRREAELAKNGFMPLVHRKNSDFAAFIGAQSLQKPAEYHDADATANARLASVCHLFACCPFAHYLKCIVRARSRWLNDWIMNYVDGDPEIEETLLPPSSSCVRTIVKGPDGIIASGL